MQYHSIAIMNNSDFTGVWIPGSQNN